jgi:hypothetical protein
VRCVRSSAICQCLWQIGVAAATSSFDLLDKPKYHRFFIMLSAQFCTNLAISIGLRSSEEISVLCIWKNDLLSSGAELLIRSIPDREEKRNRTNPKSEFMLKSPEKRQKETIHAVSRKGLEPKVDLRTILKRFTSVAIKSSQNTVKSGVNRLRVFQSSLAT